IARVETELGALHLITEKGEKVETLRKEQIDVFHQVSGELVSYWRFYTLQCAIELELFDHLPNHLKEISRRIGLPEASTLKLLRALQEMEFVQLADHSDWVCTSKGRFLQSSHHYTLRHAASLWSQEHLTCWRHISYSLKTGQPAFNQLFGKGWFDWLKDHPD